MKKKREETRNKKRQETRRTIIIVMYINADTVMQLKTLEIISTPEDPYMKLISLFSFLLL